MKATETKSTHSQQHTAVDNFFAEKTQEHPFFSERSHETRPFFSAGSTSSFIQTKSASKHQPFFQPAAVPFIQAKCAVCEAEEQEQPKEQSAETLTVQRMPAFESEEAGVQRQSLSSAIPLTMQRMPAFESEADDQIQSKSLLQRQKENEIDPEEEASPDTELQTKLASNAVDPPEDGGESGENRLPFTQAKLTIGKAGDRYEQEADAVANRVVAMPKRGLNLAPKLQTKPLRKNISKLVQRQEVFLQPKRLQRLPKIQKQGDGSLRASSDLASRLHSNQESGSSLDENTRGEMESAFGADFGDVRVHTGSNAAQLSKDLGAKAFTHGSDIYFNQGQYNPNSSEGKHLLAHELTHTVQQGASLQRKVNISTGNAPAVQLILGRLWSAGKRWAIQKFKKGLNWLAERTIPGYTLLNVFLGKNLITGEAVARSGVNLIKGYMRLSPVIGSILLSELEQTKSLSEAGKWVEGKVVEFGIDFDDIARRLKLMWNEISIRKGVEGNIHIFKKYLGPVIGKIMAFSSVVMEKVKELRFEAALRLVGATELLDALKKDPKAFKKAVDDPKAVLKKFMVGALKQGFSKFKDNFVTHFKNALLGWLFGKAAEMGVEMPKKFDIAGLFSLIAQLVGATYEKIRARVVKRLGPKGEVIVSKLEQTVALIKDLVTKGPIALWKRVESFLTNLKEMVFSKIASLVSMEIIKAAVTKLLSMLNPAGALVQLALTLYRVIKFFIDNWETIKSVATGILNSIAMVALNKIGPAAAFVEKVLAQGMKLIIAFLARIFGLGGIVDKVKALIKKISDPVKKAIGKVIDWIVKKVKTLSKRRKATGKDAKEKQHKKMLNNLAKQFTKDDGPKTLTDPEWRKYKRTVAQKLQDRTNPKLEKGVKLTIDIKDLKEPKRIKIKMRIAPNAQQLELFDWSESYCQNVPDNADFYRGDMIGKKEILSWYAEKYGEKEAEKMLKNGKNIEREDVDWFEEHAELGYSPYVGMTKNPNGTQIHAKWVACFFATDKKKRKGSVYVLKFTSRTPTQNFKNKMRVPAGPNNEYVPENEYLVPLRITTDEIIKEIEVDPTK